MHSAGVALTRKAGKLVQAAARRLKGVSSHRQCVRSTEGQDFEAGRAAELVAVVGIVTGSR